MTETKTETCWHCNNTIKLGELYCEVCWCYLEDFEDLEEDK
jgi:hypothetical protein